MTSTFLGIPLDEAIRRLRAQGVEPAVVLSSAPRRKEGVGVLRVVRVSKDRRVVTACAFVDTIQEDSQ